MYSYYLKNVIDFLIYIHTNIGTHYPKKDKYNTNKII